MMKTAFSFSFSLLLAIAATAIVLLLAPLAGTASSIFSHRHQQQQPAAAIEAPSSPAAAAISVDLSKPLVNVSQDLWGVFFEEINHAGIGGLYSQLLNNSNFEISSQKFEQDGPWSTIASPRRATYDPWFLLPPASGQNAWIGVNQDFPLNGWNSYSIYVKSTGSAASTTTLVNPGYWGINTIGISTYTVSFWALVPAGITAPSQFTISVYSNATGAAYASTTLPVSLSSSWQQFNATFKMAAAGTDPAAYFAISWPTTSETIVYFDVVALYPDDGWNGLPYIRKDLGDMVANLHPAFMRFPGGCYVEGGVLNDRFNWKNAIGPVEHRRGHWNIWGYYSEDQLGPFEYLSFIEKLTDAYGNPTRAIWVINSGNSHFEQVPTDQLGEVVQDALDSIEFILGPVTSRYGAIRAAMGHPEPFTSLTHVAIGNEGNIIGNWQHTYAPNYAVILAALKAAYPQLTYVANADLSSLGYETEQYDYHIYTSPGNFFNKTTTFDSYKRSGPKIFNSEYAVTHDCGQGNLIAALGEAAWMTGLERNSDLVTTASYAPLFVNVNDRAWNPDAIVFDNYRVYGTPSYWTQWMFSNTYQGLVGGTVQTLSYSVSPGTSLFAVVTWGLLNANLSVAEDANVAVLVKVVNWDSNSLTTTVNLNNVASGATINPTADVWTIAASSGTQENSFDAPTAVAPVQTTTKIPAASFTYTFPAFSTTIMRVYLKQ